MLPTEGRPRPKPPNAAAAGSGPPAARRSGAILYNRPMARYTLVYGVRLIPEGTLKGVEEATLKLADGSTAGLTLHTFDGTIPQLRRSLDRSLDAFFDLLPGADERGRREVRPTDRCALVRGIGDNRLHCRRADSAGCCTRCRRTRRGSSSRRRPR